MLEPTAIPSAMPRAIPIAKLSNTKPKAAPIEIPSDRPMAKKSSHLFQYRDFLTHHF